MNTDLSADTQHTRRIGIMLGRLSQRPENALQAFPHQTWQDEFHLARDHGFDGIEWIFEAKNSHENPLRNPKGRALIRKAIEQSKTPVLSVCGDYFMVHRLSDEGEAGRNASKILSEIIAQTAAIGAKRILLPWLEQAALDTPQKVDSAVANICRALPAAVRHGIMLGLEMEIPGLDYRAIIDRIGHPLVRAYYDTGNSTAAGLNIGRDIVHLEGRLGAVHIKDRRTNGPSQFLGQGDTNFAGLFEKLKSWNFTGDLVLQHYFEDPVPDADRAIAYIRSFWPQKVAA